MKELEQKIRKVTAEDRQRLETYSYSKLDTMLSCPYRFKMRYREKKYGDSFAIPLVLGSLIHKVLELKGQYIIKNEKIDYDYLHKVLNEGLVEEADGKKETVLGLSEIRTKFFDYWYLKDKDTGLTYEDKIKLFIDVVLPKILEDGKWQPIYTEKPFEFVYKYGEDKDGNPKEVIIHGFIDLISQNEEEDYKVTDYKTAKKYYGDDKIKTSLQHSIYNMSVWLETGKLPIHNEYAMVFLDGSQYANSLGYMKRALKKIDKTLEQIEEYDSKNEYPPCPTPLCYFCDYPPKSHTPNADSKYEGSCDYYSLWTRENKTFAVNKPYGEVKQTQTINKPVTNRKLIF